MNELIKARLPAGFRDYDASEMLSRLRMLEKIRAVYEKFGFDPLDTPDVEILETLVGEESGNLIYELTKIRGHVPIGGELQRIASRFDLTVPLARYYAANASKLPKPFKRWQMGRVRRGEKPQAGRYCEFMQCDIDTVGSSSMLADAEIIWVMYETLRSLGVERFLIKVNNRKILNGLSGLCGFPQELTTDVLRLLDKIERHGVETIIDELTASVKQTIKRDDLSRMSSEDRIKYNETKYGLGLSSSAGEKIQKFIAINGDTDNVLSQLRDLAKGNEQICAGADELELIAQYLKASDVPSEAWCVDLSVARGLGYYTGPVFETILLDLPSIGSVFSGGRYDGLVSRFLEYSVPATGASIGVDRLFEALRQMDQIEVRPTATDVFVTVLDPDRINDYLALVTKLRQSGLRTSIHMAEERAFKSQLAYAVKQQIPVVIICGSNEFEAGTVTIKNMNARSQQTVPQDSFIREVRTIIDIKSQV
jgi:histidyl-tRNA synthetase